MLMSVRATFMLIWQVRENACGRLYESITHARTPIYQCDLNRKDGCGNKYYLVRNLQESPAETCLRFHCPLGAGFRSTTAIIY